MNSGKSGFRALCLALSVVSIVLSLACGGSQNAPSTQESSSAAQQAPPSSPPSEGRPPLVDSRGNTVPAAMGAESAAPAGSELVWTVPPGWVSETPSSGMRKAQYALPAAGGDKEGGECAVFYFGPGQGGDVQSNVDRWASQLTTPGGGHPTPTATPSTVAGRKVLKVSMEGTYASSPMMGGDATPKPGTLLLGAIVEGPDANWFFKCTGPKKTMQAHQKEFDDLIASIHPK